MKTNIIGGGAAGFFLAITLKEMVPAMEVTICEKGNHVLRKVEASGGGRCNCTNTFEGIHDLSAVYPRGHRLLKRLFKEFGPKDACLWFNRHGVTLTAQHDHRIFPASQDSHTITDCFRREAQRLGIKTKPNTPCSPPCTLDPNTFTAITTGSPSREWLATFKQMGHEVVEPVPSLFTFNIDDHQLHALTGTTVDNVTVFLPGHSHRAAGSLLVTHWGLSGPAILRLSSHEARTLAEARYCMPLCINWVSRKEAEVKDALCEIAVLHGSKQLGNYRPFDLPQRLWDYLLAKSIGSGRHTWNSLNGKELNRLVSTLISDEHRITGKGAYKEEFVTCGGVALTSVSPTTLESRTTPNLYFAGEVLDIDGITGGFNFQAAWTTAHTVARAIAEKAKELKKG